MLRDTQPGNKLDRLCELNVLEQAHNVCRTTIVRDAWSRGQALTINAWIYRLSDGLLKELGLSVSTDTDTARQFTRAVEGVARRAAGASSP